MGDEGWEEEEVCWYICYSTNLASKALQLTMGRSVVDACDAPCALSPLVLLAVLFLVVMAEVAAVTVAVVVGVVAVVSTKGKYIGDVVLVDDRSKYDTEARKSSTWIASTLLSFEVESKNGN